MSSQFKSPMFAQVLTNHLDRTLTNFSNGSPLALNSVLGLDGFLYGFHDKKYERAKEKLSKDFEKTMLELIEKKSDGQMSIGEYDETRKGAEIHYATELFKELNGLMNRHGIHPSKNATDFSEAQDEGEEDEEAKE